MGESRQVSVHFLPELAPSELLRGSVAVVIDVLRATTTIVYALAAGCTSVRPCGEIEEARAQADQLPAGKVLLGGERHGLPPAGFDLGNSPTEYSAKACRGMTVVLTTTNGTRAILRAAEAERVLVAALVNYSAVCEQLLADPRPINIICAGTNGEPTLEDVVLAGALVDFLCEAADVTLNDSARIAWDCFEHHGQALEGALEISKGGSNLLRLGFAEDIRSASRIDLFNLVPELRRDPLRIEVGAVGFAKSHWPAG
jgi:2-phosphosulfolactate phosphatase